MSDGTNSIDWRVARLGAVSALAGSMVGAIASLAVTWWGFERDAAAADRAAEEKAYVSFLAEGEKYVRGWR